MTLQRVSIHNRNQITAEKHPFHLVDRSPWPFYLSTSLFLTLIALSRFFSQHDLAFDFVLVGIFASFYFFFAWIEDVLLEADLGYHLLAVQQGLSYGFILFILSEVMLFFSFFWAFFHLSLSPSIAIGAQWPPLGLPSIDPWDVPIVSTFMLILSALYLTLSDFSMHDKNWSEFKHETAMAVFFGTLFTVYQLEEYNNSPLSIDEGAYPTMLYSITGLHGAHVIIGAILISIGASEALKRSTSKLSLLFASWYWHFVDFVWVFVFIYLY